jgi:hypothetical protein
MAMYQILNLHIPLKFYDTLHGTNNVYYIKPLMTIVFFEVIN